MAVYNSRRSLKIEDRDVVTTPTFIVRDILNETIKKFCDGKSDEEIFNSKFADIACDPVHFCSKRFSYCKIFWWIIIW